MASPDSNVATVSEYEKLAKQKLSKMVYDFYATGSDDLWTLRENVRAFQNIWLTPQSPVDVSQVDTSTEVLGFKISMPIMVAPVSMQRMAHPGGELATARAASTANTIMVLSSSATTTLEDVDKTGPGVRFFQLYVYKNREGTAQVVRRAERAGYRAIVLTADTPKIGKREADIKNGFALPPTLSLSNFEGMFDTGGLTGKRSNSDFSAFLSTQLDQALTWKDVMWLKGITSLPILIKGVLTAEDARLAVQSGVAGIIVSNHGGRQLNCSPATIDVLGEVVEAVQGKVPVFCDGGIRNGTGVFKALALGAAGVFIGRPVVYGLAADGEVGVRNILQTLNEEFKLAMSSAGCHRMQDIRRGHILTLEESNILSKL